MLCVPGRVKVHWWAGLGGKMGKKKSSKESNIPQKEAMMRINYLYQVLVHVLYREI